MKTPTREELGLPWKQVNEQFIVNTDQTEIADFYDEQESNFVLHAANTYHDREALLKECLHVLGCKDHSFAAKVDLVSRLRSTLATKE